MKGKPGLQFGPEMRLDDYLRQLNDDLHDLCTCTARQPRPTDTEPPEPIMDRNCPVHGIDPDRAREDKND